MAEWVPDADEVKPSELIGRRIFNKKPDVRPDLETIPTNIFLDTRYNEDISLDRLGNGNFQKSTLAKLTVVADEAADAEGVFFTGWLAMHYKKIKFEDVRPDPLTVAIDKIDNPFHALLSRKLAREKAQAFHLSRSLLMAFKEDGEIVPPQRRPPPKTDLLQSDQ